MAPRPRRSVASSSSSARPAWIVSTAEQRDEGNKPRGRHDGVSSSPVNETALLENERYMKVTVGEGETHVWLIAHQFVQASQKALLGKRDCWELGEIK